jgi:hypothetical protein
MQKWIPAFAGTGMQGQTLLVFSVELEEAGVAGAIFF